MLSETLLDLNDTRIFKIWLKIGLINFIVYLIEKNADVIWVTSLRTLLFFLIAYKIFNTIMKKVTGTHIVDTYLVSGYHYIARRKITILDRIFNILLFAVIALSMFFEKIIEEIW